VLIEPPPPPLPEPELGLELAELALEELEVEELELEELELEVAASGAALASLDRADDTPVLPTAAASKKYVVPLVRPVTVAVVAVRPVRTGVCASLPDAVPS
jgi:hypothetical protein